MIASIFSGAHSPSWNQDLLDVETSMPTDCCAKSSRSGGLLRRHLKFSVGSYGDQLSRNLFTQLGDALRRRIPVEEVMLNESPYDGKGGRDQTP